MKTTIILTLICLLCFTQPSFSQDVENSSYMHLFTALFVLEGMAFMYSAVSMLDFGPQIIGSIYGLSGSALLLVPIIWALSDTTVSYRSLALPQFSIPYSIGLLGISYYNFKYAPDQNKSRRFWTNVIAINVVAIVAVISALVIRIEMPTNNNILNKIELNASTSNFATPSAFMNNQTFSIRVTIPIR